MFGYRGYRRRPRSLVGCGCGGLGTSILLSVLLTWLVNAFGRRY